MITITHNRARFTLKPEHAQGARELLALIDKTDGRKGAKISRETERKASYPVFYDGLTTADYILRFEQLREFKHLAPVEFTFADRAAPRLDAAQPEVIEEPNPDYVYIAPVAKAKRSNALRDAVLACLPDLEHYAATHGAGPDVRLAALKEALK
jgi:hypothetical protein